MVKIFQILSSNFRFLFLTKVMEELRERSRLRLFGNIESLHEDLKLVTAMEMVF